MAKSLEKKVRSDKRRPRDLTVKPTAAATVKGGRVYQYMGGDDA